MQAVSDPGNDQNSRRLDCSCVLEEVQLEGFSLRLNPVEVEMCLVDYGTYASDHLIRYYQQILRGSQEMPELVSPFHTGEIGIAQRTQK